MSQNVWFITGSSRGLGRRIAEDALAAGNQVVATARVPESLADLAVAYPEDLLVLALDVTNESQVNEAVREAAKRFGRIDVLVNNAGYSDLAAVEDATLDAIRRQIDTNLIGTIAVAKAVLPGMRERGSGRIINISSVGSRVATPGLSAYQAAKWAVSGFSEVLAAEVAPLGIRVTAIEPGGMPTDWAGSSMTITAPSAPYQNTAIGFISQLFKSGQAKPAGDLGKVAQIVLRVAGLDEPPTRLMLGSDAIAAASEYATALTASDAKWDQLTRSSDRDDASPADSELFGRREATPLEVVNRFVDEVINSGNLDVLDEVWANDLEWHGGSLGRIAGLPAFKEFMAANASGAFSGMHLTVNETIAVDDKVVLRFTNSGTQTGQFMGTPASGVHAEWLGIGIYTVTDGKISSGWFGEDALGMMLQLGVVNLPN